MCLNEHLMKQIKVEYINANESRLGGPFLCEVHVNDVPLRGEYLAQMNSIYNDGKRIALSKYSGLKVKGLFKKKYQTIFHIIVYDLSSETYYQSIKSYQFLAIEGMENSSIIIHEKGYVSDPKFRIKIPFNESTFKKVNPYTFKEI